LSQFGSFMRGLIEGRAWFFLAFPLTELATSGAHPLYRVVPDAWQAPVIPWQTQSRARYWAASVQYFAAVASPRPEALENVFRWHMFAWLLSNLAAISYSDLILDIDQAHDNTNYRAAILENLAKRANLALDFSDIKKFDRYYQFESFDVEAVCSQVISAISAASADGRLEYAVRTLSAQAPITPTGPAVKILLTKIRDSMALMAMSPDRRHMSAAEWKDVAKKNRKIWFNPGIRQFAQRVYPVAAPIVQAARRAGILN
jgi:hypothetical protein